VLKVHKGLVLTKVHKVLRDQQVLKVDQGLQDTQEHKVPQGQEDLKGLRVLTELLDQRVLKGVKVYLQEFQDHKVLKELHLVHHRDHKGLKDQ